MGVARLFSRLRRLHFERRLPHRNRPRLAYVLALIAVLLVAVVFVSCFLFDRVAYEIRDQYARVQISDCQRGRFRVRSTCKPWRGSVCRLGWAARGAGPSLCQILDGESSLLLLDDSLRDD